MGIGLILLGILGLTTAGIATFQGAKRGEPWFPGKDLVEEPAALVTGGAILAAALILFLAMKK